ncbi:type VII secretion protein EccB, partial [Mycobacterium sp. NS-7484]|uniref:type VII secretion protein EccB n=1 Tax=Mycobacterium sp. NS-7484 TaxID=1834161 RepID=UPI00096F5729
PGAPSHLGPPLRLDETDWAICDVGQPAETVLLAGRAMAPVPEGQGLLVSARTAGAPTYLLTEGRRARVDLRDIAVVRALHLDQVAAQPVSQALLDSVPEVPALRAPSIAGVGTPGPAALGGLPVGTVVRVVRTGPAEFYVVLADGLQRIGRVAADVIRFSVAQPGAEPPVIAADDLAAVPIAHSLAVGRFPERVLTGARAVICARWNTQPSEPSANTAVVVDDSLPDGSVQLAQADGAGPNVDRTHIPAGRSVLLQATGVEGAGGFSGPLYLLDDLGVLFGIRDRATAELLGLGATPVPAPWPMLAMLPRGPELSREAASVTRDSLSGLPAAPA